MPSVTIVTAAKNGARSASPAPAGSTAAARPFHWSKVFDTFTIRFPVPALLVIDAFDDVVAHGNERRDRRRMRFQNSRQTVVVEELDERLSCAEPLADEPIQFAERGLESRQSIDREQLRQGWMAVDQ